MLGLHLVSCFGNSICGAFTMAQVLQEVFYMLGMLCLVTHKRIVNLYNIAAVINGNKCGF